LVVDDLLWELNSNGYYTVGYVGDIAVLNIGKFPDTVSEVLKTALCTVQKWCDETDLFINPNKTVIIPLNRKREINGPKEPIFFNKMNQLSSQGITLYKGLTWEKQLDKAINKFYKAFWTCRGTFGKTWRLKPKVVYWIYIAIVRLIITYAGTIWWPRVKLKPSQADLSKLQRMACWRVTGAMRTAPTAAIEVRFGLPPRHLQMEVEARIGTVDYVAMINGNQNRQVPDNHT
jgi:hypothetical protein